ncbi:hypothetical protein GA0070558_10862 [Micromonospora haikouensis]|uniref:Uncharacterized protein n=1 Tax=Micromonospora haikouensis TaxID=686309 RepID=A0A1C4VCQ3_9ACTN|nr:hypothetical protein [Micromonospora haikouensis]SCE81666.1 hypothetical protein GA0070558_10862 [Micromonospora haikouensis]
MSTVHRRGAGREPATGDAADGPLPGDAYGGRDGDAHGGRGDDAAGRLRDERGCVVTALRLGWRLADAYHHAQTADLSAPQRRPGGPPVKLTNLTEMSGRRRLRMYLDGIDVALAQIATLTGTGGAAPSTAAARAATPTDTTTAEATAALPAETTVPPTEPATVPPTEATAALLLALDDLNVDVLRWAMAANPRVGLAYRLGRSLADTVRHGEAEQVPWRFAGRQHEISRWLDELASVLPPYSAAVVRRSLRAWADAVTRALMGDPAEAGLDELARELRNQGDRWRNVLTGGLHPRDLLDEEDYAVVARNVIIRDRKLVVQAARGIFWPVLVPLLVVLFAVVGVSAAAAAGSPTTRAAVALVGLGAGLTAIWRTVSGPTLAVAGEVNRPLLEGELTVRMAGRVDGPLADARAAARTRRPRHPDQVPGGSKYVAGLTPADLP